MKIFLRIIVAAVLLAASGPVPASKGATAGERAAADLLELMHLDRTVDGAIDVLGKSMVEQNHQLKPYQEVLQAFLAKYLSWDQVKEDHVRIYASAFTEVELRQLTTFYRTPTGQKLVTVLPELLSKGAALGPTKIQGHLEELQQMIRQRAKDLGATKPGI